MKSVALVGPDGAGKSTIAHEVVKALAVPTRYMYMGVNVNSSNKLLPTTRLAFALKRGRRGGDAAESFEPSGDAGSSRKRSPVRAMYGFVRLLAWLGEEWYRAALAWIYMRRGFLVVFDRHFVYDYWASHVLRRPSRSLTTRVHGWLLRHAYPRPDFVVCLDAPAELLHARKREQSAEWLDARRREYLAMADLGPDFAVVDASQPQATVVAEITGLIETRIARDAGA
jgi:thymidylate kinase